MGKRGNVTGVGDFFLNTGFKRLLIRRLFLIRRVAKKSNFAGWINAFENDTCLSINTQIFDNFQKKNKYNYYL